MIAAATTGLAPATGADFRAVPVRTATPAAWPGLSPRALGKKAGAAYIPLPGQAAAHTVKCLPPNARKRHI
ncbi:hypothetical protein [Desulfovibrio sp.]|uniref:hypothetical protein n=1 Tax=Desulfovibrio sp. TaxID=885 RepID=UPI0039E4BA0B